MDQDSSYERIDTAGPGANGAGVGDPVQCALASIHDGVADLCAAVLWSRSDEASRDAVREGFAVLQSLQSAWLGLVADLDSRPEAVPGARAGKVAQSFLRGRLLRTAGQAAADVRAAHALATGSDPSRGGMPTLGAAFAGGRVSREHVDVALRAVRKLPPRLLSEPLPTTKTDDVQRSDAPVVPAGAAVDAFFAEQSQAVTPGMVDYLARHLLDVLDPDRRDGFDPDAHERRGLTHSTDAGGMVVGRFQLDPVSGAEFVTAIEHFSAPDPSVREPTEDGGTVRMRDTRSTPQRRADALGLISRLALGSEQVGTAKGGEPPRIVVHTGVQEFREALQNFNEGQPGDGVEHQDDDAGKGSNHETSIPPAFFPGRLGPRGVECRPLGPIGPRMLGRFACEAVLQKVLLSTGGAVLDLGRETRTVSRAQRRALNARDRGCVVPGCSTPPQWCEAHHVKWWWHGGWTDIDTSPWSAARSRPLIHLGIIGAQSAIASRAGWWCASASSVPAPARRLCERAFCHPAQWPGYRPKGAATGAFRTGGRRDHRVIASEPRSCLRDRPPRCAGWCCRRGWERIRRCC